MFNLLSGGFLAGLEVVIETINTYLSNYVLLILLVGAGLFFSIRTKFVQVRCFGEGMKNVFGKVSLNGEKQKSGISSFQALATAVAAQVGTGNIVGASSAILVGGPGAIFWMWIIAFFGMATIYAEAVLAQKTKIVNADGTVSGGPVYYIKQAFKGTFGKILAAFFAVSLVLALGFMGAMVQSNSIANTASSAFGVAGDSDNRLLIQGIIGAVVAIVAAFIFIGGIKRIASVTEKLVPIMAILFILGGLVFLGINIVDVPKSFGLIFKYAFNAKAVVGGGIGGAIYLALTQGAKRGLFSNEAGMGSTPHAHAQANVKDPHEQGTTAMIGVFIDTFIVLTMTALIVITAFYAPNVEIIETAVANGKNWFEANSIAGSNMLQKAMSGSFGEVFGNIFVAVCLFFFAFSTIIGWNYFGKVNVDYLFGKKGVLVYSIVSVLFIFAGSIVPETLVWDLADMFNNLMVIPNVISLVALSGLVVKLTHFGKKSATDEMKENLSASEVDLDTAVEG